MMYTHVHVYGCICVSIARIHATVTVKVCAEKCGWPRPITCELTCELLKMAIYQDFGYQSVIMYNQVTMCIM